MAVGRLAGLASVATIAVAAISCSAGDTRGPDPAVAPEPVPTPESRGPHLYLGGDGAVWMVDLRGNVTRRETPALGPGDPPHRLEARDGGLAAWGYETYRLDDDLRLRPRVIVRDSRFFIPSAHGNRVWVAISDDDPEVEGLVGAVREVAMSGRVTVPDVRPPHGGWPEASLNDGLLFFRKGRRFVWDPVERKVVFRFDAGDLGPTQGNLVAWCDFGCEELRVTDVGTGREETFAVPRGFRRFQAWDGAFSPDGRTLAVPVEPEDARDEVAFALVDVPGGEVSVVDGTRTQDVYNYVAWSRSGRYAFFTGARKTGDRTLMAYRRGDASARSLEAEVGAFYDATAI